MRNLQNQFSSTPVRSLALAVMAMLAWHVTPLNATILFSDDFQSGLSQWVAAGGVIVSDPTYGHVLSFSDATGYGDIWSRFTAPAGSYLSFDYMGVGGFIGITEVLGRDGGIWLAGGSGYSWPGNAIETVLSYDATWRHYQVLVPVGGYIEAELYPYWGGSAYSGAFANIVISDTPIGPASQIHFPDTVLGPNTASWGVYPGPGWPGGVVPEPTTMIAGALALLPFGASALRSLRKRKQTA
jgi:hypothetical protein